MSLESLEIGVDRDSRNAWLTCYMTSLVAEVQQKAKSYVVIVNIIAVICSTSLLFSATFTQPSYSLYFRLLHQFYGTNISFEHYSLSVLPK